MPSSRRLDRASFSIAISHLPNGLVTVTLVVVTASSFTNASVFGPVAIRANFCSVGDPEIL